MDQRELWDPRTNLEALVSTSALLQLLHILILFLLLTHAFLLCLRRVLPRRRRTPCNRHYFRHPNARKPKQLQSLQASEQKHSKYSKLHVLWKSHIPHNPHFIITSSTSTEMSLRCIRKTSEFTWYSRHWIHIHWIHVTLVVDINKFVSTKLSTSDGYVHRVYTS